MSIDRVLCAAAILTAAPLIASAAEKYQAWNLTAATTFIGVYLAPVGTQNWGPNQALNDKDKSLDTSERLVLTGLAPGHYDVKLVDRKGRTCIERGIDLTSEHSFDIRDADLNSCR